MTDFLSLPLKPALLESVAAADYVQMTPVQAATLPAILAGRDVLAQARTGSGKTAAFALVQHCIPAGVALVPRLLTAARRHLVAVDTARPGDVLLFRMRSGGVAKHVGIVSAAGPEGRFIHSYQGHGVVESPLSAPWKRRIVARFKFPLEVI